MCCSLDQCYQAHFLLTLSFICGSAVWFAEGNRLFSKDNNFRNEYGSSVIPEDWLSDSYWGAWLVGEWVGVLIAGIGLVRPHLAFLAHYITNSPITACVLHYHPIFLQPWRCDHQKAGSL